MKVGQSKHEQELLEALKAVYGQTKVRQISNAGSLKFEITSRQGRFALKWASMPCQAKAVANPPAALAPARKAVEVYRCKGQLLSEVYVGIKTGAGREQFQLDTYSALGRKLAFMAKPAHRKADVSDVARRIERERIEAEGGEWSKAAH